jgi:hypothetical protein
MTGPEAGSPPSAGVPLGGVGAVPARFTPAGSANMVLA